MSQEAQFNICRDIFKTKKMCATVQKRVNIET